MIQRRPKPGVQGRRQQGEDGVVPRVSAGSRAPRGYHARDHEPRAGLQCHHGKPYSRIINISFINAVYHQTLVGHGFFQDS